MVLVTLAAAVLPDITGCAWQNFWHPASSKNNVVIKMKNLIMIPLGVVFKNLLFQCLITSEKGIQREE